MDERLRQAGRWTLEDLEDLDFGAETQLEIWRRYGVAACQMWRHASTPHTAAHRHVPYLIRLDLLRLEPPSSQLSIGDGAMGR